MSTTVARPKAGQWVKIRWTDAASACDIGWMSPEDACKHKGSKITSVGYVVSADAETITLVQNKADDGDVSHILAIPAGWVESTKVIK